MRRGLALLALLFIAQAAALCAPWRALWWIFRNQDQAFEVIKGYDLLGNPTLNGRAGEYISSRANRARAEKRRWGCILCRLLDAVEPNHCRDSGGLG